MDEVNRKILNELLKDARLSCREIARKLNLAPGTVLSRIRQMEEDKIIRGYSANLDYEKVGYQLTAVTEIVVSKGKLLEVDKKIARLPSTCAVYDVTGETDAIVIAKFRSRKELSDFTKTLLSIPFVERTNTHVVLTTIKEDFRVPV